MTLNRRTNWLSLLLLNFLISGCVNVGPVSLIYPGEKGPLSTIKPLTISVNIKDQRPRALVGEIIKNIYFPHPVSLKTELNTLIFDSMKMELEVNGHQAVSENSKPADMAVDLTIVRFEATGGYTMLGTFDSNMTIKGSSGAVLASKGMSGVFRTNCCAWSTETADVEKVLNETLADFMANFSRDPNVLHAFRLAEAERGRS